MGLAGAWLLQLLVRSSVPVLPGREQGPDHGEGLEGRAEGGRCRVLCGPAGLSARAFPDRAVPRPESWEEGILNVGRSCLPTPGQQGKPAPACQRGQPS